MVVDNKKEREWKICDKCGSEFDSLAGLSCHIRNTGHGSYNKYTTLACNECGDSYSVKRTKVLNERAKKYCSEICREESRKNKVSLECYNCGENFKIRKSASDERKYCSRKCMREDPEYQRVLEKLGRDVGSLTPSDEAIEKRKNTLEERYSKEERKRWRKKAGLSRDKAWNKGLTKEEDERVRKYAESLEGHKPFRGSGWGETGYREDIGMFVRSTWEADFVRILNYLNIDFDYEPIVFNLSENLRYCPDFHLNKIDTWVEVSGYIDEDKEDKVRLFENKTSSFYHVTPMVFGGLKSYFKGKIDWESGYNESGDCSQFLKSILKNREF